MKVKIFIKKLGRNRNAPEPVCYEYPDSIHNAGDFLKETVRINLEEYKKGRGDSPILRVLSKQDIEDQAQGGKITFGDPYDTKTADFQEAVENAFQCLEDGIVVLFVDNEKLEHPDTPLCLREGSEAVFIRMTMLAGRMW